MATKKKQKITVLQPREKLPHWETFFRSQKSPILRSQLITSIMAGKPLELDRLPDAALLDVVMLSTTARDYHQAEIIDEHTGLLRRTEEKWKDPLWTTRTFDQTHCTAANYILQRGTAEFTCTEDQYVPEFVQWLLEHDPPKYFSEEIVDAPASKRKKAA